MLADTASSRVDPLAAPTILAFRVLLTDDTWPDVAAIVESLARVLPERLPRCVPIFVVVGNDPRQVPALAHLPITDHPDPSEPLFVHPTALPQIVYRGRERLGIGDIYRVVLPLAQALDAHLIVSDADHQIDPAECVAFGRWALQSAAGAECYAVPQRVVRNFSPDLERKVEEDLMNGAVRLAVAEAIGTARLRSVWVGGYPIRDAQSSLFVLSRGAVRAVLDDPIVAGYLDAFGPQEPLWGADLIVHYGAICAAARQPRRLRIRTRPVVPAESEGHATINFGVLRQKWHEAADHLGADLERVAAAVAAQPGRYLQGDVLAEIAYDRRVAAELVQAVCRKLRRVAAAPHRSAREALPKPSLRWA